jgi:biopolymer transport protein TolR
MGMSIGKQTGAMAEMNIVPLIDILLVLLIIFMVITPLTPKGMEVLVPQSSQPLAPAPSVSTAIVVQVLADSETNQAELKINNEQVTWQAFGPRMDQIFKARAEKVAFVKGGNDVMFMDVARAVDIMRGAGIAKVGLITAKLEAAQ